MSRLLRFGSKAARGDGGDRAPAAWRTCVVAGGALRFDFPAGWCPSSGDGGVLVRNADPPNDTRAIEVAVMNVAPPAASGAGLRDVVRRALASAGDEAAAADLREWARPDIEAIWIEQVHRSDGAALVVRKAWCRRAGVLAVACFGFRMDEASECDAVWQRLMDSIQLHAPPDGGVAGHDT